MTVVYVFVLGVFVVWIVGASLQAMVDRRRHRHIEHFIRQMDTARAILREDDEEKETL